MTEGRGRKTGTGGDLSDFTDRTRPFATRLSSLTPHPLIPQPDRSIPIRLTRRQLKFALRVEKPGQAEIYRIFQTELSPSRPIITPNSVPVHTANPTDPFLYALHSVNLYSRCGNLPGNPEANASERDGALCPFNTCRTSPESPIHHDRRRFTGETTRAASATNRNARFTEAASGNKSARSGSTRTRLLPAVALA